MTVKYKYNIAQPDISTPEIEYVLEALRENELSGHGRHVRLFEERFAKFIGSEFALACPNGTITLHLILEALGIGQGDEVILPSQTISNCIYVVSLTGATPVVVDIDPLSWCMDPKLFKEAITDKTKAVMPVHLFGGIPCNMTEICKIAKKHGITVVEDCAESIGSKFNGKMTGNIGDVASFSLFANKTITCVPPGTKIVINDGDNNYVPVGGKVTKNIEELTVGSDVLTYNESSGMKELEKITNVFKRKIKEPIFRIFLSNGNRLDVTSEHPIYVHGKGFVKASELSVSDEVVQLLYHGLGGRINGLKNVGKHYEDFMSTDSAKSRKERHSDVISHSHNDPNSGFNDPKSKYVEKQVRLKSKLEEFRRPENVDKRKKDGIEKTRQASIKNWKNPEYVRKVKAGLEKARNSEEWVKNYCRGLNMKPNRSEIYLGEIINDIFPGEFEYNGDGRLGVAVAGYIPDYVNVNGKKKVIDLFGGHWHTEDEVEIRKSKMKKVGFDCLIIWDYELDDEKTKQRIKDFVYNPNTKVVTIEKIEKIEYDGFVYDIETEKNHNFFAYGVLVHNCGEGGIITTNNQKLFERMKYLRNVAYGTDPETKFWANDMGFNYRPSNLVCALGLGQLDRVEYLMKRRNDIHSWYMKYMSPKYTWQKPYPSSEPCCWMNAVLAPEGTNRSYLMKYLIKNGIETRPTFPPLGQHPYLKKEKYTVRSMGEEVSQDVWNRGILLPSAGKALDEDAIKDICQYLNIYIGE